MMPSLHRTSLLACLAVALALTGCGKPSELRGRSEVSVQDSRGSPIARAQGRPEERRAELLNRIRGADPKKNTVERAIINEKNELGLILSRSTELDDVPKLLKAMIVQMDETFPGENHVAIAYAPTSPPRMIGTARSNAQTRDITYQPASTR